MKNRIKNGVFVVINSKGGAGKTTFATQFLIPFLVEMRKGMVAAPPSGEQGVSSYDETILGEGSLPKLYEVDVKNNSSQGLKASKIFHSAFIHDSMKGLEDVIAKESSNFMRDYPIVFDVGVGEFNNAYKAFANEFDTNVLYILPSKTSESDAQNTLNSINLIQQADASADFLIVCSAAKHGHDEESFLREEFGMIFGTWLNPKTRKNFPSLFASSNIQESFVAVKNSELFDKTITSYGTTVYEAAREGLAIKNFLSDRTLTQPHSIDVAITDVKEKGLKEKNPKKRDELLAESEFLTKTRRHYLNCAAYYESFLAPSFRIFAKLIEK